jgi:hypothetical protein
MDTVKAKQYSSCIIDYTIGHPAQAKSSKGMIVGLWLPLKEKLGITWADLEWIEHD